MEFRQHCREIKILITISWQALLTATAVVSTVSTNPGLGPQASRVTLNSQFLENRNSNYIFSHRERGESRWKLLQHVHRCRSNGRPVGRRQWYVLNINHDLQHMLISTETTPIILFQFRHEWLRVYSTVQVLKRRPLWLGFHATTGQEEQGQPELSLR